uniref:Putative secreted protein n=1 Tax=Anopheles triannulatus TaxID=58253 RepID=A0A2M4B433_9DIPT
MYFLILISPASVGLARLRSGELPPKPKPSSTPSIVAKFYGSLTSKEIHWALKPPGQSLKRWKGIPSCSKRC